MRRILISLGLLVTGLTAFGQADKARQYFAKGYYMIDQRNYPMAIESFLKAIEIDSTGDCETGMKGKAHGELGYAYLRTGDTTKAAAYFDKSIALDPANPLPRQNKAVMLSMQKRNEEAYQTLEELVQLKPDFIEAYVQRGFLYNADNKRELAISDFKKALELNDKARVLPQNLIDELNKITKSKKIK
jgi:tetratricopeptide (TPR) repeat protein